MCIRTGRNGQGLERKLTDGSGDGISLKMDWRIGPGMKASGEGNGSGSAAGTEVTS